MRWFRVHARVGAWLALSALVLQIVLAFGHVHADRHAPLADDTILASASLDSHPAAPSGHDGPADHDCPICTLNHIVGSVVAAAAPSLPLPIISGHTRLVAPATTGLTASHPAHFRARAPPAA